jgi:hypothetical protein
MWHLVLVQSFDLHCLQHAILKLRKISLVASKMVSTYTILRNPQAILLADTPLRMSQHLLIPNDLVKVDTYFGTDGVYLLLKKLPLLLSLYKMKVARSISATFIPDCCKLCSSAKYDPIFSIMLNLIPPCFL